MTTPDIFLNALKQAGFRITPQRRAVCAFLARTSSHPTPYQVFAELSRDHPNISRATVYNTLSVLHDLGVIVEVGSGGEHTRYETDLSPHINLICLRCNQIVDYHSTLTLDDFGRGIVDEMGFQPVASKIEVLGFCQECRQQKLAEIRQQWMAQHPEKSELLA